MVWFSSVLLCSCTEDDYQGRIQGMGMGGKSWRARSAREILLINFIIH